jgi:hypothetical protein
MANHSQCNVLNPSGNRKLWQFAAGDGGFQPVREIAPAEKEPLPVRVVAKGWGTLFRKKLNVAWLPAGTAFMRVVQLPVCELPELLSMVEFQLEKLSPLPVAQVVWTVQILPKIKDGQQTVIVVMADRGHVESVLGQLEEQGFVADRLEVPMLDHLLAADPGPNGVWLYPPQEGTDRAWISAWWFGGTLQHLGFIYLPEEENRETLLKEHLRQVIWAGELEGWLNAEARWHLVADSVSVALWEPAIREVAGGPVEIVAPPPAGRLAALTALRADASDKIPGLIPAETTQGYHARFVDGLWMSAIGAVFAVYVAGAVGYFGYLETLKYKVASVESKVGGLTGSYTNALVIKAQLEILREQQVFKYAALETWDALARTLPAEMGLQAMTLSRERTLALSGSAPEDSSQDVYKFNDDLKRVPFNNTNLFTKVSPPLITRQGGRVGWNFTCELNRMGTE